MSPAFRHRPNRQWNDADGENFEQEVLAIPSDDDDESDDTTPDTLFRQGAPQQRHQRIAHPPTQAQGQVQPGFIAPQPTGGVANFAFPDINAQIERAVEQRASAEIREAQLKVGKLTAENRRLKTENEQLRNRLRAANIRFDPSKPGQQYSAEPQAPVAGTAVATAAKAPVTGSHALDETIRVCARKFFVFNEAFISPALFERPRPRTSSTNSNRYTDKQSKEDGQLSELYENFPESTHPYIPLIGFRTLYNTATKQFFRGAVHDLRTYAHVIFGIPNSEPLYVYNADRSQSREFKAFLTWPQPIPGQSFILPILFPRNVRDQSKLFRNLQLPLVLRGLLNGPKSVTRPSFTVQKAPSRANGRVWGSTGSTPGAMSYAIVLSILVNNTDHHHADVGEISGFRYADAFEFYKQLIVRALQSGGIAQERMEETMDFWDDIAFPGARAPSARAGGAQVHDQDEMIDMLAALQIETPFAASPPSIPQEEPPHAPSDEEDFVNNTPNPGNATMQETEGAAIQLIHDDPLDTIEPDIIVISHPPPRNDELGNANPPPPPSKARNPRQKKVAEKPVRRSQRQQGN
ncbi:hypothetical protein DFP72DRAFT_1068175 [Ephemerocybe angulata]|uniref:Uncharacterized protein n=1 Tax=Ephemerocybe angulata TaxID=980116 RepID=A0A8H6M7K6_9AGAR|nr:hypothetical protein DFP72DRAFT_1068175 [Tulosesus angulatus]